MKYPRVSIITATYNNSKALKNTLNSLLAVDYPSDYEMIVVNDGSTDDTEKVLEKFRKHKKITMINFRENQGVCRARNAAIKKAKFEIIANMDHDCTASKNWLKDLVKGFSNEKIGVVSSYGGFGGTSTAFRADVLKSLGGYDEDYRYFREDTDLAFKFIEKGFEFKAVKADFIHDHSFVRPRNFPEILAYAFQRIRYRMNDVLLFKKHPELAGDFLHVKYGFIVDPFFDMSIILGSWDKEKKSGEISSPRGFTIIKGRAFFHKIIFYTTAIAYMLALKLVRLIASFKHGRILI